MITLPILRLFYIKVIILICIYKQPLFYSLSRIIIMERNIHYDRINNMSDYKIYGNVGLNMVIATSLKVMSFIVPQFPIAPQGRCFGSLRYKPH